ncbi:hypothetical protein AO252_02415 [Pseudomonas syringae pv. cerasicola]|uniref:Uncharacterized protein n=1 Tax=Pseudomonas syringae pv. daphniphylli TaxID=264455 RepID=A0A9X0H2W5_PSESX|nr:hypothetical protein ALO73_200025 [Pseudomonas syringae pv. daphniphylli]PHN81149.1 hypothetical protein AO272_13405 [Pseudomonas syringae pv. cerasicola]PHN82298.1 hypothetical protein AO252_02415 [Pseudomonas syringae pv. cerasicola]
MNSLSIKKFLLLSRSASTAMRSSRQKSILQNCPKIKKGITSFFFSGSSLNRQWHFIKRLMLILMRPSLKSEETDVKGRV